MPPHRTPEPELRCVRWPDPRALRRARDGWLRAWVNLPPHQHAVGCPPGGVVDMRPGASLAAAAVLDAVQPDGVLALGAPGGSRDVGREHSTFGSGHVAS